MNLNIFQLEMSKLDYFLSWQHLSWIIIFRLKARNVKVSMLLENFQRGQRKCYVCFTGTFFDIKSNKKVEKYFLNSNFLKVCFRNMYFQLEISTDRARIPFQ